MATFEAEIFSAGTWNGDEFTVADLEEIARNFETLKPLGLKPPLKFGHDDDQNLLGQDDGAPAIGWVDSLEVAGEKLIATFADVPELVAELIRANRYRRVSSEIYFRIKKDGKEIGKALKAVALLGADIPAVTNLQDLAAFLVESPATGSPGFSADHSRTVCFAVSENGSITDPKGTTMSDPTKDIQAAPPAPAAPQPPAVNATDEAELAELRKFKADAAENDRKRAVEDEARAIRKGQEEFGKQKTEMMKFVDDKISAGELEPRFRDEIEKEVEAQAENFTEDSKLTVPAAVFVESLSKKSGKLPGKETAADGGGDQSNDSDARADGEWSRKVRVFAAEKGMPYLDASRALRDADPEAFKAYTDSFTIIEAGRPN